MSKIQIITSVSGGILDDVTLKIGDKIITNFKHLAFDWDEYDCEETAYSMGDLKDCTKEDAEKHYDDIVQESK